MKLIKGLYTDAGLNDTPQGFSPFIKNAVLTEKIGSIVSERGFNIFSTVPYTINGILPFQDEIIVFNTNNFISEIGKVNATGAYTKIINDDDLTPTGSTLNFDTALPILAEAHKNAKGEIIIAWIDDENTPKVVNVTTPSTERTDYELFPIARTPVPQVEVLDSGGSLLSGVYRLVYNHEDDDGTQSDYSVSSQPVSIIAGLSNASAIPFGSAPKTLTTKSISVSIQPTDRNWKYINLYVIKNIDNQISCFHIKKIPNKYQFLPEPAPGINEYGIVNINYSGTELETPVLLESLLSRNATYLTAKAIGQLNNKLYLANLTAEEEIKLQQYCTGATAKWTSKVPRTGGSVPNNTSLHVNSWKFTTFEHGEVYALYLQFRIKATGQWTKAFHLPGRDILAGDDNVVTPVPEGPYLSGTGSPSFKLYQLDDTCAATSYDLTNYSSKGTLGFWENVNETYPDHAQFDGTAIAVPGGRNLKGAKVKHHKFPTIRYMKNYVYRASNGYTENIYGNVLDVLGLEVDLGLAFNQAYTGSGAVPTDLLKKIDGWRVLYAKRDIPNATVLGTSQIYHYGRGQNTFELKPIVGSGQAHDNGVNDDIYFDSSNSANIGGAEYIRFHAFNLMVDKPSIAPTYLRQELFFRYTCKSSPASTADPRLITDTALDIAADRKYLLYNQDTYDDSTYLTETGMTGRAPKGSLNMGFRYRAVEFVQYMPPYGIIAAGSSTINNSGGEEHLLLRQNINGLDNGDKSFDIAATVANSNLIWANNSYYHGTYLSSLCVLKTDVYNSFLTQALIACDGEIKREKNPIIPGLDYILPVTGEFTGGDCWVGPHSIQLTGPISDNAIVQVDVDGGRGGGYKAVAYFWTSSPKNLNYRYEDTTDAQSAFYPKNALLPKIINADYATRFLGIQDLTKPLKYLYDNSFNTRNDLVVQGIYDPELETVTKFPNTIISSLVQSPDTEKISWKSFLAGNRYIMPRDKGDIINLQGVGNQRLYIHQENGLFITKDRTTLKGDIVSVTLGSSDIFEVTPFEVLSTEDGYAGTKHKFGCVLTKIGYVFADTKQCKIFIHDGEKLDEISRNGLRQFWIENINQALPDNPFQGNGITFAYDEKYNRLLCTFNDTANNKFITASYAPELNAWVSYHDYNPSYLFSTGNNNLYSVKNNNTIYKHNVGDYGKYYQTDNSRFPLIVDAVYNPDAYNSKNFTAVKWTTQVYNQNKILQPQVTFTSITVRSASKTTGKILLSHFLTLGDIYTQNTRLTETSWNFNDLRNIAVETPASELTLDFYNNYNLNPAALDLTKDWYEQGRMIDNFVVCRFEYDNLSNNQLILLDHDISFRKSYR